MDSYLSPCNLLELKLDFKSIIHKNHNKRDNIIDELNSCLRQRKINLDTRNKFLKFLKINKVKKY